MTIQGIDVSSWQGETPSLRGMSFCFVKATEGTHYVNPKMKAQASHARSAGVVVGFYHFVKPGSMKAQAAYFVDKAASREGDPLWLDWEDAGVSCTEKDEFIREVKRLRGDTHRVGLYCNTSFWLNRDTTSYAGDALWIARYGVSAGSPGIEHKWLIHQYTDSPIDTNVARFADTADMRRWATRDTGDASDDTPPKGDDTPAMSQASKILNLAKGEVGYREGSRNWTKYAPAVPGLEWAQNQPWCATWVSWLAMKTGLASLYPRTASCATGVRWFKQRGRWSEYPAVGAQIFYGPGGGTHTGIVYDYDGTYVYTYEGNTNNNGSANGDGVYKRRRARRESYVYGYGYPEFANGIKSADPNPKWKKAQEADPMAGYSKKDICAAAWNVDGVVSVPPEWGAPGNDKWKPASILVYAVKAIKRTEAKVEAANSAVSELAKALGSRDEAVDVDALVARIQDAVNSIDVTISAGE